MSERHGKAACDNEELGTVFIEAQVADELRTAGFVEVARLVRVPAANEQTDQAVIIAHCSRQEANR